MKRIKLTGVCAAIMLIGLTVHPACAQDASATIARAQETLAELDRLLTSIHSRPAGELRPVATAQGSLSMFDGASLEGWKQTDFRNGGNVHVERSFRGGPSAIVVEAGPTLSGLNWVKEAPTTNYEISLESMKIQGGDFMCGLTFPVGSTHASLILGGWGGNVVGISSIDGADASENETTRGMEFQTDHWYRVRLRVTPEKLQAWLDGKEIINVGIKDRKIGLRFGEISKSVPIGLATYQTKAAYRNIVLKRIDHN